MKYSLNDILNSFDEKNNNFDYNNIFKKFKKKYSELSEYVLVKPKNVKSDLLIGDFIRYSKSLNDKLSTVAVIVSKHEVINKETGHKTLDYIVLESLKYKKNYWKIYPDAYFIFRRYASTSTNRNNTKLKINKKGGSITDIIKNIEKNITDNKLNFKELSKYDNSILNKIKWNDPLENDIDNIDNLINYNKKSISGDILLCEFSDSDYDI